MIPQWGCSNSFKLLLSVSFLSLTQQKKLMVWSPSFWPFKNRKQKHNLTFHFNHSFRFCFFRSHILHNTKTLERERERTQQWKAQEKEVKRRKNISSREKTPILKRTRSYPVFGFHSRNLSTVNLIPPTSTTRVPEAKRQPRDQLTGPVV